MKIISQKVFKGKNIYSFKKCIRIDVDLCGYCEIPSKEIPDFNDALIEMIPELFKHRCGIDEEHGFIKRLREGTYLAHICEHIIIAIQNMIGIDMAYGKSREIKGDLYYIIFQYEYEKVGLESARLAIDIINSLINKTEIKFKERFEIIKNIYNEECIGPSTKSIKEAAEKYGLPVFEIANSGIYQIGYGKQGRRIEGTIGNLTSCLSADIASDKLLTKELLLSQNIPVPQGSKISNIINLLKQAESIGFPVVLKPQYGSKGKGVIINIRNEKELLKAYNSVKDDFKDVIIEEYIEGDDYRICLVDYDVVAVSKRIPPFVTGNGKDSIKELIKKINLDINRGIDHEKPLTKIKIDESLVNTLEKQGLNIGDVIEKDKKVFLRQNANLSTGGIAVDCTDEICKENIDLCIRAAKIIGLDICGIDIKALDISKPLYNQGAIMEINAAPGIRMHEYPKQGKVRDVGEAIIRLQYNGVPCNIPVISITGTNGKTTTTRLISHIIRNAGYCVGMTSTEGIYINSKCIDKGDDTGFNSAKAVLLNPDVEVAVLETARGGIIKKGLAYENADIAIITNITEDHIGVDSINSIEDLAFVKSLVGEAVKEEGFVVINADDNISKTILNRIKAKKIFFSKDKENNLIQKSILENDIAIYCDKDSIYIYKNKKNIKIMDIKNIPITLSGILNFNIENSMAAIAATIALGIDIQTIVKSLKTFKLNCIDNHGRFNIYYANQRKIILDYGHNIDGYKNVISSLKKVKNINRLIGVIGIPGDRQDKDAERIGEICDNSMDYIFIKEDIDRRGREPGEIARLIENRIKNTDYQIKLDEKEALKEALKVSKAGDTIIVFYENMEPLVEVIEEYKNKGNEKLDLANM